jgi:hypothetical protein
MGGAAVPIALGAMALAGQHKAAKAQREAAQPAKNLAGMQKQLFGQAQPYYSPILAWMMQHAGIPGGPAANVSGGPNNALAQTQPIRAGQTPFGAGSGGPITPAGTSPQTPLPMGSTAMPESQLGVYGQGEDRLRFAAAEEELDRIRKQRAAELLLGLQRQGAGAATTSAALARNEGDYMQNLAGFRRNLAINAGDEQEQRVAALLGALSPGFGLGQSAAGTYGNLSGIAAGQANASGAAMGDALSNYLLYQAMRRQQQPGTAPGPPPPPGARWPGATPGYVPPRRGRLW